MNHTPVLLNEVIAALAPAPGMRMIDCTYGAGGYTRAIISHGAEVMAIDQDPNVIAQASPPNGAKLVQGKFADLADIANRENFSPVDGVVFDIGVSSMQLDEAERGFSFLRDGPLDMRMSQSGPSAADIVNSESEEELAHIIFTLGEEPASRKIAKTIVRARAEAPITRTHQLAEIVARAARAKPGTHPATRTFQALRIHVNSELDQLRSGLNASLQVLRPGGTLAVVTFHSLEDRIVKQFMDSESGKESQPSRHMPLQTETSAEQHRLTVKQRKAIAPSPAEREQNPRARSAKLRVATRTPFFESGMLMENAA